MVDFDWFGRDLPDAKSKSKTTGSPGARATSDSGWREALGLWESVQRFSLIIHAFDESSQLSMGKRTFSEPKINGTCDSFKGC